MHFLSKFKYFLAFLFIVCLGFSFLSGCDDSGNVLVDSTSFVVHYDSIGVADGIGGNTFNGINLYNGTTVTQDSLSKDAQLVDSNGTFYNYMLRSGDMSDLIPALTGFKTRFNRIYASMDQAGFDTITMIGNGDSLTSVDFTSDDTYGGGAWGYFNAPMSTSDLKPVYSFWLEGKSGNFIGRNVYGILYPREATDVIGGGQFRMSFEVRINTMGLNDFEHGH